MRIRTFFAFVALALAALACAQTELPGTATPAPAKPPTQPPTPTIAFVTATPASDSPSATPTEWSPAELTATAEPAATIDAGPTAQPTEPPPTAAAPDTRTYLDDRSDPRALVWSYVNALARHEPLRAHGYWRDTPDRPDFADLEAETLEIIDAAVEVGPILADAGAGQRYFVVPALITFARNDRGTMEADCFFLKLSSPELQAEPPFRPLGIERLVRRPISPQEDPAQVLAEVCPADAGGPYDPPAAFDPDDIGAERYLDDRSDPTQVLRSMFNALNRREYARAYGYWDALDAEARPFDEFAAGYENTRAVTLEFGEIVADAGAGQYHYQAPVILRAETTTGAAQVFVACYTLHISNPSFQASPPFQPLAIRSGTARQVTEADAAARLSTICLP